MPGKRAAVGEDHGPRYIGRKSQQFPIDEVPEATQTQTDGSGDRQAVEYRRQGKLSPPTEPPAGDHRAQQSAVEGHATVPGGNNFQWILEISQVFIIIVKNDISQAGANDETNGYVKNQVLGRGADQTHLAGPILLLNQEVGCQKPQDVHESVPADVERPDGNHVGIDMRIGNHFSLPPVAGKLTHAPSPVNGIARGEPHIDSVMGLCDSAAIIEVCDRSSCIAHNHSKGEITMLPIICIVGASNSGKTTFLEQLIPELRGPGLSGRHRETRCSRF